MATWNIGRQIGKLKPDVLMVLHGTSRTTLMGLAMHPKYWTGEEGTGIDHFFMDQPIVIETYNSHAVNKYLRVLQLLGVKMFLTAECVPIPAVTGKTKPGIFPVAEIAAECKNGRIFCGKLYAGKELAR